ncbi:MAG TPA: zf-HC2 domain-containing protein [Thermoanaerobaculia bacterium]|nr:zf-HC2 domain-containing protein [Thermoanaerobaculia bacterium]
MNCPQLEQTSALFDGELDEAQTQAARAHVSRCAECSALETDLQRMRVSLRELAAVDMAVMPWWRRRIAIPVPLLANLVLAVMVLAAVLVARPSRTPLAPAAPAFREFDARKPPVVYVRPRSVR